MRLSPTVSQEKQEKKENVNISKTVSQYPLYALIEWTLQVPVFKGATTFKKSFLFLENDFTDAKRQSVCPFQKSNLVCQMIRETHSKTTPRNPSF